MKTNTLEAIYADHTGKVSDKWSIYLIEYERIFSQYRHKPLSLLEIGIQNGGSLEILAKYFQQGRQFVGSDINPDCAKLVFDDPRISFVLGDANTDKAQSAIQGIAPSFEIILDDGSHRSNDIVKSFARYFPLLLDGGVFIIEDLHCSYWAEFEGGLFDPYSSLAFFKKLTDVINHEFWGIPKQRASVLKGFFSKYDILIGEETLQQIHSIEFINSMCVIKKMEHVRNVLGPRFVAGQLEAVSPANLDFHLTLISEQDQSRNKYATGIAPEDEVLVRNMEISYLIQQRALINAAMMNMRQEEVSFGSVVGRTLNRLLARFARGGAKRQHAVSLVTHFARTLESNGVNVTLKRLFNYIYKRMNFMKGNLLANPNLVTDHPELAQWIDEHEPNQAQLTMQTETAKQFSYSPLISTIVPIYKVPREVLHETLTSLERQTYANWQACLVWADTEDLVGWEWLKKRTVLDQRFKIKLLEVNGGISVNSDSALELADGEFIALLDHDDTITPWAYFEIVSLLQSRPELDLIYSDKDSISADGRVRMNALFKPDWSPEMLHSVNYLTHLNVIRTSLIRSIGGWRPETDGAQDWDLFFRIAERTKNVARVASILYHWRILPTSTASGLHTKPYAALAQLRTQQDYFLRRGLAAAVVPTEEGMFKVCWLVRPKSLDVIVYQTGTVEQLKRILAELMESEQPAIRHIHVVHSNGGEDYINLVHPSWRDRIVFTCTDSVNWYKALEIATASTRSQTLILLDGRACRLSGSLVEELGGWVTEHPDIAWASALAINEQDIVFEAGRVISTDGRSAPLLNGSPLYSFGWFGGPLWYRNSSACSPYAVALKAGDAARIMSEFNSKEQAVSEFSEFCRQLTTGGRRGLINPFAKIYFEHAPEKNWFNEGAVFHSDPYFNPAFSQVSPLRLHS